MALHPDLLFEPLWSEESVSEEENLEEEEGMHVGIEEIQACEEAEAAIDIV